VYLSDDLVHCTQGPRVFTHPGPNVWTPEVYHDPDTKMFSLYITSSMRIGVAVPVKYSNRSQLRHIFVLTL